MIIFETNVFTEIVGNSFEKNIIENIIWLYMYVTEIS